MQPRLLCQRGLHGVVPLVGSPDHEADDHAALRFELRQRSAAGDPRAPQDVAARASSQALRAVLRGAGALARRGEGEEEGGAAA